MRQSEKSELMSRIQEVSELVFEAKEALLKAGGREAAFQTGMAYALLNRLFEDVKETEADLDEEEDAEDVILHGPEKEEQPAAGAKARVKVSNLPEAGTLPPTKEVRVPDEELPKPKKRGRQPKTLTLDEDLPDPLE